MAHCVIQRNNCPSDPLKTLIPNWNNFKKPYSDTYFFQILLWQTLPLCRFLYIQNKPCPFLPGQCSALLSAWQPLLSETCTDSPSPVSLGFQASGCDGLEAASRRKQEGQCWGWKHGHGTHQCKAYQKALESPPWSSAAAQPPSCCLHYRTAFSSPVLAHVSLIEWLGWFKCTTLLMCASTLKCLRTQSW